MLSPDYQGVAATGQTLLRRPRLTLNAGAEVAPSDDWTFGGAVTLLRDRVVVLGAAHWSDRRDEQCRDEGEGDEKAAAVGQVHRDDPRRKGRFWQLPGGRAPNYSTAAATAAFGGEEEEEQEEEAGRGNVGHLGDDGGNRAEKGSGNGDDAAEDDGRRNDETEATRFRRPVGTTGGEAGFKSNPGRMAKGCWISVFGHTLILAG